MAVSDSDETNSQGTLANSSEHGGIDSGELKNVAAPPEATCAGLGGVVGRFVEDAGNQIFVANDLYTNQLWNYRSEDQQWLDHAMMRGCGHGFNGRSTAFMGVAVGDFNGNGMLEFRVTNFRNESVTLFVNQQGFFRDRNAQFVLSRPSTSVPGLGPQTLNYHNNGTLDLVVANGHIEKAIDLNAPFYSRHSYFRMLETALS